MDPMMKKFLESEMMDEETCQIIYDFVALDNFRHREYEGNEYVIPRNNRDHIQIENEVGTENTGMPYVESYRRGKFLHLLEGYKR